MTIDTRTDVRTETAPGVAACGAIVLARHGEPALSRKVWLTAQGYADWWAKYEEGGLLAGQAPPPHLVARASAAGAIYCSTRLRSIETAAAVAGERTAVPDALYIEAPLPPPAFPSFIKLTPRLWGVVARFWWWFFDHHAGQETKAEALVRAARAADALEADACGGRDVLLLAHGFFNNMVGMELTKRGWRCVKDRGFKYWSAREFEKG